LQFKRQAFILQGMNRYYHQLITELLDFFPCVAITGVRQCGKTTLLKQLPSRWKIYDLEKSSDFDIIARDTDLFFRLNSEFIALDEAQLLPEVFSALRVAIDADRNQSGRFIITGSSSPELLRSISESLAGRVAIIEMAPLSLSEAYQIGKPEIYSLIEHPNTSVKDFLGLSSSCLSVNQQHNYWMRGGYPELWVKKSPRFAKLWMQNYLKTYFERDIGRLFPGLNRDKYRLFINMLGQLSGNIVNYSQVARALGVSQPTVREYFNIAHGTFVWRHIPAYEKNAEKRIVKHPKGYLRDSGLLNHLLHLQNLDDLLAHPVMGHSWESMVIENLIRGLNIQGISFDYFHYRTSAGAEVDLVLEGEFGLIPVEIKYAQKVPLRQLRGIQGFLKDFNCSYGVVISNAERIALIDNNLINIPFAYL